MSSYDEVEIEDMEWDNNKQCLTYPCPCGDLFQITLAELQDGEIIARCPSCSLFIEVVYNWYLFCDATNPIVQFWQEDPILLQPYFETDPTHLNFAPNKESGVISGGIQTNRPLLESYQVAFKTNCLDSALKHLKQYGPNFYNDVQIQNDVQPLDNQQNLDTNIRPSGQNSQTVESNSVDVNNNTHDVHTNTQNAQNCTQDINSVMYQNNLQGDQLCSNAQDENKFDLKKSNQSGSYDYPDTYPQVRIVVRKDPEIKGILKKDSKFNRRKLLLENFRTYSDFFKQEDTVERKVTFKIPDDYDHRNQYNQFLSIANCYGYMTDLGKSFWNNGNDSSYQQSEYDNQLGNQLSNYVQQKYRLGKQWCERKVLDMYYSLDDKQEQDEKPGFIKSVFYAILNIFIVLLIIFYQLFMGALKFVGGNQQQMGNDRANIINQQQGPFQIPVQRGNIWNDRWEDFCNFLGLQEDREIEIRLKIFWLKCLLYLVEAVEKKFRVDTTEWQKRMQDLSDYLMSWIRQDEYYS